MSKPKGDWDSFRESLDDPDRSDTPPLQPKPEPVTPPASTPSEPAVPSLHSRYVPSETRTRVPMRRSAWQLARLLLYRWDREDDSVRLLAVIGTILSFVALVTAVVTNLRERAFWPYAAWAFIIMAVPTVWFQYSLHSVARRRIKQAVCSRQDRDITNALIAWCEEYVLMEEAEASGRSYLGDACVETRKPSLEKAIRSYAKILGRNRTPGCSDRLIARLDEKRHATRDPLYR